MNKRGVFGIIVFFLILFTILIVGFIAAMATGIIGYASDELLPIMQEVGVSSGEANLSSAMNYTFDMGNNVVQAMPWVIGFSYVLMLIFSIVFIVVYKENPSPALMGFYVMMVFLLILGAIIMSNMYQDIYSGTDVIAERLQDQALMSYMILYSPFIMGLIAFIGGAIMFAGGNNDGGGL